MGVFAGLCGKFFRCSLHRSNTPKPNGWPQNQPHPKSSVATPSLDSERPTASAKTKTSQLTVSRTRSNYNWDYRNMQLSEKDKCTGVREVLLEVELRLDSKQAKSPFLGQWSEQSIALLNYGSIGQFQQEQRKGKTKGKRSWSNSDKYHKGQTHREPNGWLHGLEQRHHACTYHETSNCRHGLYTSSVTRLSLSLCPKI